MSPLQVKYQSSEVAGSFVSRCGYNSLFPWNRPGRSMLARQETQRVRNSFSRVVRFLEAPSDLAIPVFCRSNPQSGSGRGGGFPPVGDIVHITTYVPGTQRTQLPRPELFIGGDIYVSVTAGAVS